MCCPRMRPTAIALSTSRFRLLSALPTHVAAIRAIAKRAASAPVTLAAHRPAARECGQQQRRGQPLRSPRARTLLHEEGKEGSRGRRNAPKEAPRWVPPLSGKQPQQIAIGQREICSVRLNVFSCVCIQALISAKNAPSGARPIALCRRPPHCATRRRWAQRANGPGSAGCCGATLGSPRSCQD